MNRAPIDTMGVTSFSQKEQSKHKRRLEGGKSFKIFVGQNIQ